MNLNEKLWKKKKKLSGKQKQSAPSASLFIRNTDRD